MSKRLNLSNFPPDMIYRLLTTVLFGNATTSFFRAQLRKLRGCARLGLTVIGNQKSKNQSRRGFQLHISIDRAGTLAAILPHSGGKRFACLATAEWLRP